MSSNSTEEYRNVPEELKAIPNWVGYKLVKRDNGKYKKVPINSRNGKKALTNDPQTWSDFQTTVDSFLNYGCDGVGFVLMPPYVGIDLDGCRQDGQISPEALKILQSIDSYTEISPSGSGVHMICKGSIDKGFKFSALGVEVYQTRQYFTMTGNMLPEYSKTINDRTAKVHELIADSTSKNERISKVGKIKEALSTGTSADKFKSLFDGDWSSYSSQSEADLALCGMVARKTKDPQLIDAVFRKSNLYRPKWDESHFADGKTYGQGTIELALETDTTHESESVDGQDLETPMDLKDLLSSDVPPVRFWVPGILQEMGRTMVAGSPGSGKSMLGMLLAVSLATPLTRFLNHSGLVVERQARVLFLDLEMGLPAVKERFKKMTTSLDMPTIPSLFINHCSEIDLLSPAFQETLSRWLEDLQIDVLIIDPIGNAWSGDESNKQEVTALTKVLNRFRAKLKLSIVIVHHWRKVTKGQSRGADMASGSHGWGAWTDNHISIQEMANKFTVSCEKARNGAKFPPFILQLNTDNFTFEYVGGFDKKLPDELLLKAFQSVGTDQVPMPRFIIEVQKRRQCVDNTVRGAVKTSKLFEIDDKSGKTHMIQLRKVG